MGTWLNGHIFKSSVVVRRAHLEQSRKVEENHFFLLLVSSSDPIQTVTTFILIWFFWPSVTRAKKYQSNSHFVKKRSSIFVSWQKIVRKADGGQMYLFVISKSQRKLWYKNNTSKNSWSDQLYKSVNKVFKWFDKLCKVPEMLAKSLMYRDAILPFPISTVFLSRKTLCLQIWRSNVARCWWRLTESFLNSHFISIKIYWPLEICENISWNWTKGQVHIFRES